MKTSNWIAIAALCFGLSGVTAGHAASGTVPYREYKSLACEGNCVLNFSKTPKKKTLVLKYLSCTVGMDPFDLGNVELAFYKGKKKVSSEPIGESFLSDGGQIRTLNGYIPVPAGQYPKLTATKASFLNCSINGDLVSN